MDWVLVGGESGGGARPCDYRWMSAAIDEAQRAGAAPWLKQWGTWRNNPLYAASRAASHVGRVRDAIAHGERLAQVDDAGKVTGEKGGATLDGATFRDLPASYARLRDRLRGALAL
jgi:hypothetical protein